MKANDAELKALLDPALDRAAVELAAEETARDSAGAQAVREPLPGPAREAFAACPDEQVGPYKVRAARDRDIKVLSQLNNAYYKFVMTADPEDVKGGQDAYELCWIMTRPAREVKALVEKNGLDWLRAQADDEFGDLATADLMAVVTAAARQLAASCSTAVKHVAPDANNENGEAAKSDRPPSGARLTATGGS
jgi:hypothetical protein